MLGSKYDTKHHGLIAERVRIVAGSDVPHSARHLRVVDRTSRGTRDHPNPHQHPLDPIAGKRYPSRPFPDGGQMSDAESFACLMTWRTELLSCRQCWPLLNLKPSCTDGSLWSWKEWPLRLSPVCGNYGGAFCVAHAAGRPTAAVAASRVNDCCKSARLRIQRNGIAMAW